MKMSSVSGELASNEINSSVPENKSDKYLQNCNKYL